DALRRDLHAVIIRAKDPLHVLKVCEDNSIRVILNHRLALDSPLGHFTVLTRVGSDHVVLHDPDVGPSRKVSNADLRKLWEPTGADCEITGRTPLAGAKAKPARPPCPHCRAATPASVTCRNCKRAIPLQPAAALGCVGDDCPRRNWEHIICPYCDVARSTLAE